MKNCTKCGAEMQDNGVFCIRCGAKFEQNENASQAESYTNQPGGYTNQTGGYTNPNGTQYYAPPINIYDHTAEFDRKDISDNKVIAMLVYLASIVGIIIALLAANTSKYAAFHVRQALKFLVLEIITGIICFFLLWTVIVPIAAGVFYLILWVCKIICFFSICKGQAKEPPIVRSFGFLN